MALKIINSLSQFNGLREPWSCYRKSLVSDLPLLRVGDNQHAVVRESEGSVGAVRCEMF